MKGKMLSLSLFLCLLAGHAFTQDVTCTSGTQSFSVVLNDGDVFSFETAGRRYKPNMDCTATYQLGEDCSEALLDCPEFNTAANRRCTKGDVLTLEEDFFAPSRFCRGNGPDFLYIWGNFTLRFTSDGSRQKSGFKCSVSCYNDEGSGSGEGPVSTSTTSTASPTTGGGGGGGEVGDCKCGLAKRQTRIVGGTITEVNEYPWQAGLVNIGSNRVWCGGALISDQWVLTAAHCVDSTGFQVLLGEHDYYSTTESDRIRAGVAQAINHPSYDSRTTDYDFSLVKLTQAVNFTQHPHIRPICLPEGDTETYDNFAAIVTGWGTTSSGGSLSSKLREVTVEVLSNAECEATGYSASQITDQMLCAGVEEGGKDSCQGDSGGPLVTSGSGDGVTAGQNYEHIGVVSWGRGCALANYPGVYARTSKQLAWIASTTGTLNTCPRT